MKTLPDLARAASEALAEHSGDKQKLGLEVRVYVPQVTEEERLANKAQLDGENAYIVGLLHQSVPVFNQMMGHMAKFRARKVESPGS